MDLKHFNQSRSQHCTFAVVYSYNKAFNFYYAAKTLRLAIFTTTQLRIIFY